MRWAVTWLVSFKLFISETAHEERNRHIILQLCQVPSSCIKKKVWYFSIKGKQESFVRMWCIINFASSAAFVLCDVSRCSFKFREQFSISLSITSYFFLQWYFNICRRTWSKSKQKVSFVVVYIINFWGCLFQFLKQIKKP